MNTIDAKDIKNDCVEHLGKVVKCNSENEKSHKNLIVRRICTYLRRLGYDVTDSKKLLNIDCGDGSYVELFRHYGVDSIGLEMYDADLKKAQNNYPKCDFIKEDLYSPSLKGSYDIIFIKESLLTNTHNVYSLAQLCEKYTKALNDSGWFILCAATDFSGTELRGEATNWAVDEIITLADSIDGVELADVKFLSYNYIHRKVKSLMHLYGIKKKYDVYLFFKKIRT